MELGRGDELRGESRPDHAFAWRFDDDVCPLLLAADGGRQVDSRFTPGLE